MDTGYKFLTAMGIVIVVWLVSIFWHTIKQYIIDNWCVDGSNDPVKLPDMKGRTYVEHELGEKTDEAVVTEGYLTEHIQFIVDQASKSPDNNVMD